MLLHVFISMYIGLPEDERQVWITTEIVMIQCLLEQMIHI